MSKSTIHIIGAGLAGCEAAWQAAERGIHVVLYDMKPHKFSPAHRNKDFAELVCSNSFRSDDVTSSAVGVLHQEMRLAKSLIMQCADETRVPAGGALAVDRDGFAALVTEHGAEAVLACLIHRLEPDPVPETAFKRAGVRTVDGGPGGAGLGAWLAVGVGREDGIHPRDLQRHLAQEAALTPDDFGDLRLLPRLTLMETTVDGLQALLGVNLSWRGRRVKLREAEPPRTR